MCGPNAKECESYKINDTTSGSRCNCRDGYSGKRCQFCKSIFRPLSIEYANFQPFYLDLVMKHFRWTVAKSMNLELMNSMSMAQDLWDLLGLIATKMVKLLSNTTCQTRLLFVKLLTPPINITPSVTSKFPTHVSPKKDPILGCLKMLSLKN